MKLSETIVIKSDQLNAEDLAAGPRDLVVTRVVVNPNSDQKWSIYFEGDNNKPWKPCSTVIRTIVREGKGWADPDLPNDMTVTEWAGRIIRVFRNPNVVYASKKEGGIRICGMSHIPKTFTIEVRERRGKEGLERYTIEKLEAMPSQEVSYDAQKEALQAAAMSGSEALKSAWLKLSKAEQSALAGFKDKCKDAALKADQAPSGMSEL